MSIAKLSASNSTCSRLAVGTVIVSMDPKDIIVGTGYNGTPSGMKHCNETKGEIEPGKCFCVHSEMNAIIHSNMSFQSPKKAYITVSPCLNCAKALVTFGVKEIYYNEKFREFEIVDEFLRSVNVKFERETL